VKGRKLIAQGVIAAQGEQPDPQIYGDHYVGGFPLMMALSIIESIPGFIMFIIFREQLMKGIRLRGFK